MMVQSQSAAFSAVQVALAQARPGLAGGATACVPGSAPAVPSLAVVVLGSLTDGVRWFSGLTRPPSTPLPVVRATLANADVHDEHVRCPADFFFWLLVKEAGGLCVPHPLHRMVPHRF